jgi:serine/threonine-protein kinase
MSSESAAKGPQRTIQIGKYRVLAHLATGGMGAVYKAYDAAARCDIALKVLTPEMAAKPIMIERFRREARNTAKLKHENIVQLYEFGESGGIYYIAMEFVEGIDLAEYIDRKGPLDPDEALRLVTQAAKALDHAHRRGIVHRDIKPSNFLLTRRKGRLVVKLSDFGLSREASTEEFRVTRAGTTVGTVDYISPEQARDSGTADIRSDLYSLGCSWHHLLTGQPPFAEGGLAERLHKHLSVDPPDPRASNPRVSQATAAVLRRLLAKRPADRYQTPAELLRDLYDLVDGGAPSGRRAVLLGLLDGDALPPVAPRTRTAQRSRRRAAGAAAAKSRTTDPARRTPASPVRIWYIAGGAAAVLLAAALIAGALLARPPHSPSHNPDPDTASLPAPPIAPPPNPGQGDAKPPDKPPDRPPDKPPDKPRWPVLDPTAAPVDVADLGKTVEGAWAGRQVHPADAPVFRVARAPDGGPGPVYPTLAAAAAAVSGDKLSVLEIDDDGPLFETSTVFTDRRLVICAGRGFRPLLVWDAPRSLEDRRPTDGGKPPAFLTVERGSLHLENLDVVFTQPDAAVGGLALLDVHDADWSAEGCTFSLAGKPREGVTLTRFHGARPDSALCRFTRCYLRGSAMTAVDLDAPGASLVFDRSLVVGGDPSLLRVRADDARATFLTAAHSTLICGRTVLTVERAADSDRKPVVSWLGWDSLLSRSSDQPNGDMVAVAAGDGVTTTGMQWRAYNCLYAGWRNLLTGPETIAGTDAARWRAHWDRSEGDMAFRDAWPAFNEDRSVLPASAYRTDGTPVGFAATAAPDRPLGCDLDNLPPTRVDWAALTTEGVVVPPLDPITDDAAPAVKLADDKLYHGGRIDLSQPNFDLGAFVRDYQQKRLLAPRVVLLLSGTGDHPITPFHLQGTTLVLYADPPKEDAPPLTLTWDGQGSVGQDGLIEVEDGGLEMIDIHLKLADFPRAAAPASLLKVRGDLRLFRCRLEGPEQYISEPYHSLIALEGSGDPAPNAACACAINESVLVSGRDGVQMRGVGVRLLLRQSVLAAGGDALHFDPGPKGPGNVQCLLEHSTLAFRRAAIHLEDADAVLTTQPRPQEDKGEGGPFVVRSQECAFLDPFDKSGPSGMVVFEKSALAHGLLVWQGEGDAFAKRLTFAAAPAALGAPSPDHGLGGEEVRTAWTKMWGSYGDRQPAADVTLAKSFDAFPWALDRLAPPKLDKHTPGADFTLLRLIKKPAKP